MELLISLLALIFAMLTFYLAFHSADQTNQQRVVSLIRTTASSVARIATYIIVLLVFVMSLVAIYLFWTSDEPIRRPEVIMLILHMTNTFMYGYLTLALPVRWVRARRAQDHADPVTS